MPTQEDMHTMLNAALDQWVAEAKARRAEGQDISVPTLMEQAQVNLGIDLTQPAIPSDTIGPAILLLAIVMERLVSWPDQDVSEEPQS